MCDHHRRINGSSVAPAVCQYCGLVPEDELTTYARQTISRCNHERSVTDHSTASAICRECGLVLEERIIAYPHRIIFDSTGDEKTRERIRDILEHMRLPELAVQESEALFRQFGKTLSLSIKKSPELLAYSIYEALNRLGIPRAPDEIAFFSEVETADLLKIEKKLAGVTTYCEPALFTTRICGEMELPFTMIKTVHRVVRMLAVYSHFRPECLTAAALLLYLEVPSLCKNTKQTRERLTLSYICLYCNVAAVSVTNLLKRIKKTHIQNVEQVVRASRCCCCAKDI